MGFRESEWSNSEGELSGKPAWLRRNESIAASDRDSYPFELIVHLVLDDVDDDGLPYEEENLIAGDFEEKIAGDLERRYDALFAIAITSDGVLDLFFYLSVDLNDDEIEAVIVGLDPPLNFDFGLHDADNWANYDNFG